MNKYTWYVVQSVDENGRMYAWTHRVANNNNILNYHWGDNVVSVNACDSKHDAMELVEFWNECSWREDNYAFDEIKF